jgi:hypothetical protein
MAQTVSRRPSTAKARVRARVSPCGICGGQSNTGTDFSPSSSGFPCQYDYSTRAPYSSGGRTIGPLVATVQRNSLIPSTQTFVPEQVYSRLSCNACSHYDICHTTRRNAAFVTLVRFRNNKIEHVATGSVSIVFITRDFIAKITALRCCVTICGGGHCSLFTVTRIQWTALYLQLTQLHPVTNESACFSYSHATDAFILVRWNLSDGCGTSSATAYNSYCRGWFGKYWPLQSEIASIQLKGRKNRL